VPLASLPSPCYVISDAHVGIDAVGTDAEHALLTFLDACRAGSLVINGDLFDFWFEWKTVIPRAGYRVLAALATLRERGIPVLWVAGNHDCIHINRADLNRFWQRSGPLYYSLDHRGWHFVVLHTIEQTDVQIRVPETQLGWLRADLAATDRPTIALMHHPASDQDLDDSRWWPGRSHLALVKERAEIREIFERSGRVRAVFNGHLHWNHLDVIAGIPYVTVQSLIENLDDDAPGRPAASHAEVHVTARRMVVRVRGNDPARYQFEW